MTVEEDKALVRRFVEEAWGKENLAIVEGFLASNFVLHAPPPGVTPDREGYKQWVSMTSAAFSDIRVAVEDVIAEGDRVVTRWSWHGTHKGEMWGIAPTSKRVAMTGISIDRVVGSKIVEEWIEMDNLGMMQQLGMAPEPGQSRA